MYLFLNSEPQFHKSKEFNKQRINKSTRGLLKHILLLSLKNNKEADRLCMRFPSTPKYYCAAGASTSYFKINAPIFCCPLFFKEYLSPYIMINKTNIVSITIVVIQTLSYFYRPLGHYLCPEFF